MQRAIWLAVLLALAGCSGPRSPTPTTQAPEDLDLSLVADQFSQPVHVAYDALTPGRIYVVEQVGRIVSMDLAGDERRLMLDITDRVGSGNERGLFAVSFTEHVPGRMFVHYTDKSGDTVLSSFSYDPLGADAGSEAVFLRQDQPYANHNGGQILFRGRDLYIGLGDGGGSGDPQGNGQDLSSLLGKILRIQPGAGTGYVVPEDNPFLAKPGARPEVWAYGLRNPWRFSFDRETGELFIGDVGQNQWEEVDWLPANQTGGANFGWNRYEGTQIFRAGDAIEGHVGPIHEYATGPGGTCAVTGGFVYRGKDIAGLQGVYVFADYCSGDVWGLERSGANWSVSHFLDTGHAVASFGEDARGEVYLTDRSGGGVYRLVAS